MKAKPSQKPHLSVCQSVGLSVHLGIYIYIPYNQVSPYNDVKKDNLAAYII